MEPTRRPRKAKKIKRENGKNEKGEWEKR